MLTEAETATLLANGGAIARAIVTRLSEDLSIEVVLDGAAAITCDRLVTAGDDGLRLATGDSVLVWHSGRPNDRGVMLGRVGPSAAPVPADEDMPAEVVVEASDAIMLRVGDGSITITADGRILIKGTDLVSHASRLNRVKGGAVAIN
jgi:hypothetical protein